MDQTVLGVSEGGGHIDEGEDAVDVVRHPVVGPVGQVELPHHVHVVALQVVLVAHLDLPDEEAGVDLSLLRGEEREVVEVQHLSRGRPVLETLDSALLLAVGQHDDVAALLLHHQLPEVQDSVLLGTLCHYHLVKDIHVVNVGRIYVGGRWGALFILQGDVVVIKGNDVNEPVSVLINLGLTHISTFPLVQSGGEFLNHLKLLLDVFILSSVLECSLKGSNKK